MSNKLLQACKLSRLPVTNTERAWLGGPLRRTGSSHGLPSKYVCETCRRSVVGVYRAKTIGSAAETWLCGGCLNAK
jgi:hypothetical protein